MSEFGYEAENMVPAPAGTATARAIFTTEDGILIAYGTTVPSDAAVGYAPSCVFHKVDGSTLDTTIYVNIGSKATANFDAAVMAS